MQVFNEYGLVWEVDWDISSDNQKYSESDISFLRDYTHCKSLKNLAVDLNRKISALAHKLKKLGILSFDTSLQSNWEIIQKYSLGLSVNGLKQKLKNNKESTWESYNRVSTRSQGTTKDIYNSCSKTLTSLNINTTSPEFTLKIPDKKEKQMARRTAIVELFDDNRGLDVKHSRVLSKEVVTETEDNNSIIQQMLLEAGSDNVSEAINKHNELRLKTVDEKILQNTGNEVMLREVKIQDLRWSIR